MLLCLTAVLLASPFHLRPALTMDERDAGDEASDSLLLRAERVLVAPGEELEDVSILVQHGVVVAVGPGLTAPAGTREIQAELVCAAFLNPWTTLGVEGASVADMGTSPATRTVDGFDPYAHEALRAEALRGGVTAARVQAGLLAPNGGLGAVLRLADLPDLADRVVIEDACEAATVGISRGDKRTDVFDRVGEVDKLVARLQAGKRYRESWVEYRYDLEEWEKAIAEKTAELEKDFKKAKKDRDKDLAEAKEEGKDFKEKKYKEDKKPKKPRYDADDEAMARAYHGEVPLVVEAHGVPEIRALLEGTSDMGRLRLVLAGATEALPIAKELAERDVPVIVWPAPRGEGGRAELEGTDLGLAAGLQEAGVKVLIGTGGEPESRDLRLLAALAVGHGLDPDEAFAAVTQYPAEVFDVGRHLGTVERGKDADLLVLDGNPFETTTNVRYVISKGRVVVEP